MTVYKEKEMGVEAPARKEIVRDRIEKFSMRGLPLLAQGATTEPLVLAENLFLMSKVYAEGGENALHAHRNDDHAFFVLAGKARFYNDAGEGTEVGALEGILIPTGVNYRFESLPPDNLVILRMAGAEVDYYTLRSLDERVAPDGSVLDSKDPRNHPGKAGLTPTPTGELFGQ